MKTIAHAWVGLMALRRLARLSKKFDAHYKKQAQDFVKFFRKHKDAFVQGAWFPDSVISDNLAGGHTYKLRPPKTESEKKNAKQIGNGLPAHLSCPSLITDKSVLKQKLHTEHQYTLPDRCEALAHSIRDMILIQKKEPKGSDIMFNDDQITLYFLMLSHYLADAHVPPHSDARDFYTPATIHPDMEDYWDKEITKYYSFDAKEKVFDYDIEGAPELQEDKKGTFQSSFLQKALDLLEARAWNPAEKNMPGSREAKIYDYLKSVCLVSYLLSTQLIPLSVPPATYNKLKILQDQPYFDRLNEMSPHIFADAIDSIALIWLMTWDKYNKLEEDIATKKAEIKKSQEKK